MTFAVKKNYKSTVFNDAKIVRMTICDRDVACYHCAVYEANDSSSLPSHYRHATSNIEELLTRAIHMLQFAVIFTKLFTEFPCFLSKNFPHEK